jgi:hypothetical protein
MTPATATSLISKPTFQTHGQCLISGCSNIKSTYVSGYIGFNGPIGTAFKSERLEVLQLEVDEDLIPILGSAVH